MSFNKFGNIFTFTTWGESHGKAIGAVIDGVPPLIELSEQDIQPFLDMRRPGSSKFVTQRQESDTVEILSGVFEGKTTGTPISLIIYNEDQRSRDYSEIKDKYRPGHADYTYNAKYGIRDYRGGGRSSARETAMRVAVGAVARKILPAGIEVKAGLVQIGSKKVNYDNLNWNEVKNNPFFCPDKGAVADWEGYLSDIRKLGSSVGAVVEVVAFNVQAGLGSPVYRKMDSHLAEAMMSINAVKSVEIGAGAVSASLTGEENADEIVKGDDGTPNFLSNNAGGILGGITTGQPIVVRFAVKPTSSILTPRKTINTSGNNTEIITKGRHDPCVGIRAVPVAQAMMNIVLADQFLMHRAQCGV